MTFDELLNFVESELRMSHVYQPLLISFLVESGGAAKVRETAVSILARLDEGVL